MKLLNLTFSLTCLVFAITLGMPKADAQIIITEIMYNPPESGTDTLEFIEIYNAGASAVNIQNYSLQVALVDTFPSFSLAAGSYYITCKDTAYFRKYTGVKASHQWRKDSDNYTTNALNNGGETIKLHSNTSVVLDSVAYDDVAPWPNGTVDGRANGGGASIVLCDFGSDNNEGANWGHCSTSTGKFLNGKELKISPFTAGSCLDLPVVDIRNRVAVQLYPNPARTNLTLETNTNKSFDVLVTDLIGRVVMQQNLSGNKNVLDISNLPNGPYILQIRENNELIGTEKFSVNK